MALPPILAIGNRLDILCKSEKEVFEIIESAVGLSDWRWPVELCRRLKPFFNKQVDSDDDHHGDGYITSAVSDRETEYVDPTKRRKVIRIQLRSRDQDSTVGKRVSAIAAAPVSPAQKTAENPSKRETVTGVQTVKDLDSSNFHKPTTTSSAVRKPLAAMAAPKWKLKEEEYEKKLENSKRKLREGYEEYTDSRKRSKVIAYIPPQSNHHRLSDQKKSKLLTTWRRC